MIQRYDMHPQGRFIDPTENGRFVRYADIEPRRCDQCLPQVGDRVLVADKDYREWAIATLVEHHGGLGWLNSDGLVACMTTDPRVTHWAPFPPLPEFNQ